MRMTDMEYEESLAHYGILRKSGRYPWGSGANPNQRSKSFLDITNQMRKDGMTDPQIAKSFSTKEDPFSVADLRALRSRATTYQTQERIRTAQRLKDKGMGASEIGRQMGVSESTVRSLLEPGRLEKLDITQQTADMLKRQVDEKGYIDVGAFVEKDLPLGANQSSIGISPDKFKTALSMLKEEGYNVYPLHTRQVSTGEMTKQKVLAPPGKTKKDVYANRDSIRLISEKTDDRGRNWTDFGIQDPLAINPKRVDVKYKEDGGADADGVIYVRPGVKDISLGKSTYAQVRIQVGDGHYLKGMAVYKDDLPKGVDLQFNTNKSNTGNKLDAFKELKRDPQTGGIDKDNPFGAMIKQGGQIIDPKTKKVTSAMNLVNEEGDWSKWSKNIASQVLSKQKPELAETQLDLTYDHRRKEFDDIKNLTNPQVKKKLLETFADETDSAAVHLKAAKMPNQATKVLLPSTSVKPTEIFAPTYKDGERVALVRYPHAGTFEIPELTVNNKTRAAKELLQIGKGGTAPDVVVIHPKVAERLSGADFDGDTVTVIPNNTGKIKSTPALAGLKNFDPRSEYGPYDGMKTIDGGTYDAKTKKVDYGTNADGTPRAPKTSTKQHEMGNVTNLISDMTIRGASGDEIARAVRHSMVVIDSEKHSLDYKASERQNGIRQLKKDYQGVSEKTGQPKGASTLVTKATSETRVDKTKAAPTGPDYPGRTRMGKHTVENKTGKKLTIATGEHNVRFIGSNGKKVTKSFLSREEAEAFVRDEQPKGEIERRKVTSQKLAETDNAYTLVSSGRGTRIEQIYADHSNRLKSLANEARREYVSTKNVPYDPDANKVYKTEVKSLESKLDLAERNAPLERQAQRVAQAVVAQRKRANPHMDKEEERKIKSQALAEARIRTGAKKTRLGTEKSPITDREWLAIQEGAISNHKLERILKNADLDVIRERATPRIRPVMTDVMTTRAKQMLASGYTMAEVAEHLNIAPSTLESGLKEVT